MEMSVRQQEIVMEAIRIIARQGYKELTTKNLAGRVGVSEAALYRHFSSKTEIIHTILECFREVADKAFAEIFQTIEDPLLQVRAFVMSRYELFIDNPDWAKVMFSEELFMNDSSLAEHHLAIMHSHGGQLVSSLLNAQRMGLIRSDLEVIQILRMIIGSMRLLVTQWNLSKGGFALQDEGVKLWNTIEKLITKEQKK